MCEACNCMEKNSNLMTESQVASYVQEQVKNVMNLIPMFSKAARLEERNRIIAIVKQREEAMPYKDYSPQDVIDLVNGELE